MKKLILIAAIVLLASCSTDDVQKPQTTLKTAGTYLCGGTNLKGQRVMFTIYQGRNMMYFLDANGSVTHQEATTTITTQRDRSLYCQMNGYINTDC